MTNLFPDDWRIHYIVEQAHRWRIPARQALMFYQKAKEANAEFFCAGCGSLHESLHNRGCQFSSRRDYLGEYE